MDTGLALEGVLFKYNTKFDSNGPNILPGAFDSCDGEIIPLSYRFHKERIGYATLSAHDNSIYFTAFIETSEKGKIGINMLKSGNMTLGIFANQIKYDDIDKSRNDRSVISGRIRECSIIEKTKAMSSEIYTVDGMKYDEWCKNQCPNMKQIIITLNMANNNINAVDDKFIQEDLKTGISQCSNYYTVKNIKIKEVK